MNKIQPLTIPNYISYFALLLSLISIWLIINELLFFSLAAALLAFVADSLDGFVARKLKQESEFGRQFDGFVDIFIYLIYPSLVYYLYFQLDNLISQLILYAFILTGIFRLVRFNLIGYVNNKYVKGYPGLPVFSSYLTLGLVYLASLTLNGPAFQAVSLSIIAIQSFLMTRSFVFPKPDNIWPLIVLLVIFSIYIFYLGLS